MIDFRKVSKNEIMLSSFILNDDLWEKQVQTLNIYIFNFFSSVHPEMKWQYFYKHSIIPLLYTDVSEFAQKRRVLCVGWHFFSFASNNISVWTIAIFLVDPLFCTGLENVPQTAIYVARISKKTNYDWLLDLH